MKQDRVQSSLARFAAEAGLTGHGRPDFGALARDTFDELEHILSIDSSGDPRWFSEQLADLLGPIERGTVTIVGARPGCGKTTFLTALTRHLVLVQGKRVVYAGMEMSPARLQVQMAAQDMDYDPALVVQRRWQDLPPNAKQKVLDRARFYRDELSDKWVFVPDERLTPARLIEWIRTAKTEGFDVVVVDHIHEMDWGSVENLTSAMSEGLRRVKDVAKETGVRLILAAQLKRGIHDVLEDYMVPPQSAIKQSGAAEEVASLIIMLHRALKRDVSEGDLQLVRRGQRSVSEVAEAGTMAVFIAKSRLVGDVRDHEIRLYIGKGQLFDSTAERDGLNAKPGWRVVA